jgi:hypothetical protein
VHLYKTYLDRDGENEDNLVEPIDLQICTNALERLPTVQLSQVKVRWSCQMMEAFVLADLDQVPGKNAGNQEGNRMEGQGRDLELAPG